MTETPASGQPTEDDELTACLVAGQFSVYLRKPTDGQLAVLMMMSGMDVSDGFTSIVGNLGAVEEVMVSLCLTPDELEDPEAGAVDMRALKRMMARGEIELEDYFGPAIAIAQRWGEDKEIPANREAKRVAAKKAPAKKATARPAARPLKRTAR